MNSPKSLADTCLKDKNGKLAIWQTPNLPIILWVLATLLAKIVDAGRWHNLFDLIAFGALFTWACMEIFSGDSYFRRALGVIILGLALYGRVF